MTYSEIVRDRAEEVPGQIPFSDPLISNDIQETKELLLQINLDFSYNDIDNLTFLNEQIEAWITKYQDRVLRYSH